MISHRVQFYLFNTTEMRDEFQRKCDIISKEWIKTYSIIVQLLHLLSSSHISAPRILCTIKRVILDITLRFLLYNDTYMFYTNILWNCFSNFGRLLPLSPEFSCYSGTAIKQIDYNWSLSFKKPKIYPSLFTKSELHFFKQWSSLLLKSDR